MARRNVSAEDRALGLHRPIARRDLLHGAGLLAAAGALGGTTAAAAEEEGYPPLRQGLRGSHPGSFEAAHALRDGDRPDGAEAAAAEQEDGPYDLAVVGTGISGLAAAHFFREARPGARVLLLDNHDDFGGHARRNEFREDGGRLMLMNGGTMSIDTEEGTTAGPTASPATATAAAVSAAPLAAALGAATLAATGAAAAVAGLGAEPLDAGASTAPAPERQAESETPKGDDAA